MNVSSLRNELSDFILLHLVKPEEGQNCHIGKVGTLEPLCGTIKQMRQTQTTCYFLCDDCKFEFSKITG